MNRIKQLLNGLQEMGEGGDELNLIVQVPVLDTGGEGTVYIDIMPSEEEEEQQDRTFKQEEEEVAFEDVGNTVVCQFS
jgi:hypothetical protein